MKKFSFMLAILFAFIFIGCSDGGGGSETTTNTTTYSIDSSSNNALMGPLKNATVNVYKLTDLNASVETTQTNDLGSFSLSLSGIPDTEMLIVAVSGGKDIDANDDGIVDNTPTINKGTIRGIAKASDLKNGNVNITLLSEVLYKYVEHLIGNVHQDDLEQAMDTVSTKLLKVVLVEMLFHIEI